MIPHDRRSAPRIDSGNLLIHSEVGQHPETQCLGLAVTLDLNEFGVRAQTADSFNVGERYRFSIALGDAIVSATGRIVHVAPALNGTFEMGVEFLQIAAEDIDAIRKHVAARKHP